jgi:hypothetical protein
MSHDELTHRVAVHGVIQAIEWTETHVLLSIVCEGKEGRHVHALENRAPQTLLRALSGDREALKVGDELAVEYAPFESGQSRGVLTRIVWPDGRSALQSTQSRHAPPAPPRV